jgi:hypothetical protein
VPGLDQPLRRLDQIGVVEELLMGAEDGGTRGAAARLDLVVQFA